MFNFWPLLMLIKRCIIQTSFLICLPQCLIFNIFIIGNLFHIDFGYILGRDPKPFPPPMKLNKEMVSVSPFYQTLPFIKVRNKGKKKCPQSKNFLFKNLNVFVTNFVSNHKYRIVFQDLEATKNSRKIFCPIGCL